MTSARRVLLLVLAAACVSVPGAARWCHDQRRPRHRAPEPRPGRGRRPTKPPPRSPTPTTSSSRRAPHIANLKQSIAATKAHAAELRAYARQRAVFAYTHPGQLARDLRRLQGHRRRRPPPAPARPGQPDRQRRRQTARCGERAAEDPAGRPRTAGTRPTGDQRPARRQAHCACRRSSPRSSRPSSSFSTSSTPRSRSPSSPTRPARRSSRPKRAALAVRADDQLRQRGPDRSHRDPGTVPVPGAGRGLQRRLRRADRPSGDRHVRADRHPAVAVKAGTVRVRARTRAPAATPPTSTPTTATPTSTHTSRSSSVRPGRSPRAR